MYVIPALNHSVFKHTGISWEWGIVFLAAGVFFAGVEAWKCGKRVYFHHKAAQLEGGPWKDLDIEQRAFAEYM
jgi:hypothetical protein